MSTDDPTGPHTGGQSAMRFDDAPKRFREAIAQEDVVVFELRNYRKDGSSFWNALHLGPIYNDEGELIYFFGSQWDVSDVRAAREEERHAKVMARELSHRMKNMFAVIAGIVNVTGRVRGIQAETAEINARIQALGRAYETTLDDASSGSIEIGPAIRSVLSPYSKDDDRRELKGNGTPIEFGLVSVVGLTLHELSANATKYGAWSREGGVVTVEWETTASAKELRVSWQERGGPQINRDEIRPGTGSEIVDRLLRSVGGSIERSWNESSFEAVVTISL